jgi:alkylation response protein AidB-like acyl-CoA dehydrogenase
MMTMTSCGGGSVVTGRPVLDVLEELITTVVEPSATDVDANGTFPRAAVRALGDSGLLGLISSADVGGLGQGLPEAAQVVRRLAASCGSTAMVACMHYSAVSVIEAHGPASVRAEVAAGRHLSTLAFSEAGSRSQFWAPLGTAQVVGESVMLDASKSWVTSAGEADSYVWTSRAMTGEGATLWLVPSDSPGLTVAAPFDGLGLRGNASSPIEASGVAVSAAARLGDDGAGMDLALSLALPIFQVLNASCSLGFTDAAIAKLIVHVSSARLEHLGATLADQPVVRQHLAHLKGTADAASTLVDDAIAALGAGRHDAPLRMLQSKAVAGSAAIAVLDEAMLVGGGAAFRKDIGIERHFRDARASAVMAPTLDALQEFIGRALCGLPLFG